MRGTFSLLVLLLGLTHGNSTPIADCPPQHASAGTKHIADSTDITKYYICDWGHPRERTCPAGMRWDPSIPSCVRISKPLVHFTLAPSTTSATFATTQKPFPVFTNNYLTTPAFTSTTPEEPWNTFDDFTTENALYS